MHACRWSGKEFNIPLAPGMTVAGLKDTLQAQTNVLAKRQKVRAAHTWHAPGSLPVCGCMLAQGGATTFYASWPTTHHAPSHSKVR